MSHLIFIENDSEKYQDIIIRLKVGKDEYYRQFTYPTKDVKVLVTLEPGYNAFYFCARRSIIKSFKGHTENSNCFDESWNYFNLLGTLGVYGRTIEINSETIYKIKLLKVKEKQILYAVNQPAISNILVFLTDIAFAPLFYPIGWFPRYFEEYAYKFETETVRLGDNTSKQMKKMGKVEKKDDHYFLDKSKSCDDTIYYVADSNKNIIAKSIVEEDDEEKPEKSCSKLRIFYANMEVKEGNEVYAFSKEP